MQAVFGAKILEGVVGGNHGTAVLTDRGKFRLQTGVQLIEFSDVRLRSGPEVSFMCGAFG